MGTPVVQDDSKAHWLASDYDDPSDIAILFDSLSSSNNKDDNGCGHALRWDLVIRSIQSRQLSTCPICNKNIVMICDGGVVANSSSVNDDIITFKYGKQIYRLSLQAKLQKKENNNKLSWILSNPFFSTSKIMSNTTDSLSVPTRIINAFGMTNKSMKILYKGKILYPIPKSSKQQQQQQQDDQQRHDLEKEVSRKLLDISISDWETKKTNLVVMGTRGDSDIYYFTTSSSSSQPKNKSTFSYFFIHLPFNIVKQSITWCLEFLGLFAKSFLPITPSHHNDD